MNQLERMFAMGVAGRAFTALLAAAALLTLTVASVEAQASNPPADGSAQAVRAKKKKVAPKVKTLKAVRKGARLTITAKTNMRRGRILVRVIPQNGGKAVKRVVRTNRKGVAKTVFKVKKPSWGYVYVFSKKGKKLNFQRTTTYK